MKAKVALFDLDGTMINSMDYHYRAWVHALGDLNILINKKEYFPLEGMSLNLIAEKFLKDNYFKVNKKKVLEIIFKKKEHYKKNSKKIKIYDGVKKLLVLLKNNKIKLGIVSSSHYDQIKASLNNSFLNMFDTVISGDMVKKNKPNPEPYFLAASKLNTLNHQCIVFENSPLGILSAQKANMFCIGICSTNTRFSLRKSNITIDKFQNIYKNKKILNLFDIKQV